MVNKGTTTHQRTTHKVVTKVTTIISKLLPKALLRAQPNNNLLQQHNSNGTLMGKATTTISTIANERSVVLLTRQGKYFRNIGAWNDSHNRTKIFKKRQLSDGENSVALFNNIAVLLI